MATILPASHADKIQWLNDIPVWVDQWSLPKEKIEAASYSPKRNILPYLCFFASAGAIRGRTFSRISVPLEYTNFHYQEKIW